MCGKRLFDAFEIVNGEGLESSERFVRIPCAVGIDPEPTVSAQNLPGLAEEICRGVALNEAEEKARLAAWTVRVNAIYNLDITKTRE